MNINLYLVIFFIMTAIILKLMPFKNKSKIFINVAFLALYTVLIIREPQLDLLKYNKVFRQMSVSTFSALLQMDWEILYMVLNLIIKFITSNERIFMAIISFLGLLGPYYFIKKYSNNYFFSIIFLIILEIYHYNFYILRQSLAVSILLFSIKYIEEKKIFKFLLIVLLATGFHNSSIVFLLAYPICNVKLNKTFNLLYSFLVIFVYIFRKNIVNLLYTFSRYSSYTEIDSGSDGIGRLLLLVLIFIAVNILDISEKNTFKNEKLISKREKNNLKPIFENMLMVGIMLQTLALEQSVIVRLTHMFVVGAIVLIPNSIYKIKDNKTKMLFCGIILLCSLMYIIIIFNDYNYAIHV